MRLSLPFSVIFLCALCFSQGNSNPNKNNKNTKPQSSVTRTESNQESAHSATVSSPPSQSSTDTKQQHYEQSTDDRIYRVDVLSEPTSGWTKAYVFITAGIGFAGLITVAILWRQTNIARDAANAALTNAQAVLNTERAWILTDLEWPNPIITYGMEYFTLRCDIVCINAGRTPAWISEKRIGIFKGKEPFPRYPPLDKTQIVFAGVEPLTVTGKSILKDAEASHPGVLEQHTAEEGALVVIFGSVTYRDIHDLRHTTTFGYKLNAERTRLTRLVGYPEWNKND
jgi:hypothetical protein